MSKITGKKCLLISLAVSLALIIAGAFVFGFIGFNPDSVTKDYSKVEVSYYGNQLNSDDFLAEIESLCADTIEDGGYKISETRRSDEASGSKRLFEFILGSDLTAEQSASLVSDLETALRAKTVSGDVTVAEDDDVTVAYISDVEYVPHYEYIWRTAIGGGVALVLLFAYVAIRFKVGMVFQYPEYQLFEETVFKDVAFGPKNMGLDEAEIDRRVHEAADFVGLDPALLERSPFELSGGQKRRVAVAGVMAMRPRILVLDEPAAGLDPEGRDDILSEVKEYHKKTGTTVLLVSHSMEDIAKYANRVLVMSNKKIAMYDTVEKVFARAPELLGLGLSVPQVTKIFLKLREMGVDVPADVYTIPYAVKMILEAKRRRDAGESLVLPRADKQEGGADKC